MDRKIILILSILILFSFSLEGKFASYSGLPFSGNWINNDQDYIIPASYYIADGLFADDVAIQAYIQTFPNALFYLHALGYSIFGSMNLSYLIIFLLLKVIFVFSSFHLSKLITNNDRTSLLISAGLAFTHFMGVEEVGVSEVVGKGVAFSFVPLLIYFFLKNKKYSPLIFGALGILTYFHALTTIPLFVVLIYSLITERKNKEAIYSVFTFGVLSLPFFISILSNPEVNVSLLKSISPYFNPYNGIRPILKYIPIILLGIWSAKKENKLLYDFMLIFIGYSTLSILALFSDSFVMFTFFRTMKFVIFLSFIFSIAFIMGSKYHKLLKIVAIGLIIIPFSSIHYSSIFPDEITIGKSPQLKEIEDLRSVGFWIEQNSQKSDKIMAPLEWRGLRVWSKRALISGEGDLFMAGINPSLENDITQKYNDVLTAFERSEHITDIASKYGVRYIVTYQMELELNKVFSSGNFNVYEN